MQNEVEQLEISIEEAKSQIEDVRLLEQLYENGAFQKIVVDGFFKEEAIRLVHLRGDPNMQSPERQASILNDIDGIGVLKSYFSKVYQMGMLATTALDEDRISLDELREEGDEI
jgi:hypothetical protein